MYLPTVWRVCVLCSVFCVLNFLKSLVEVMICSTSRGVGLRMHRTSVSAAPKISCGRKPPAVWTGRQRVTAELGMHVMILPE